MSPGIPPVAYGATYRSHGQSDVRGIGATECFKNRAKTEVLSPDCGANAFVTKPFEKRKVQPST